MQKGRGNTLDDPPQEEYNLAMRGKGIRTTAINLWLLGFWECKVGVVVNSPSPTKLGRTLHITFAHFCLEDEFIILV